MFEHALSDIRQMLAIEILLKDKKNAFYFNMKVFLVLRILKFLSYFFGHAEKQLD